MHQGKEKDFKLSFVTKYTVNERDINDLKKGIVVPGISLFQIVSWEYDFIYCNNLFCIGMLDI